MFSCIPFRLEQNKIGTTYSGNVGSFPGKWNKLDACSLEIELICACVIPTRGNYQPRPCTDLLQVLEYPSLSCSTLTSSLQAITSGHLCFLPCPGLPFEQHHCSGDVSHLTTGWVFTYLRNRKKKKGNEIKHKAQSDLYRATRETSIYFFFLLCCSLTVNGGIYHHKGQLGGNTLQLTHPCDNTVFALWILLQIPFLHS